MKLVINVNGKISYITVHDMRVSSDHDCIELLDDGIRIHTSPEQVTIRKNLFSFVTPFSYKLFVDRSELLEAKHDESLNILNARDWLLSGAGFFYISNIAIVVDDDKMMITVKVPKSALVTLELDDGTINEIMFESHFVIEDDEITIKI